MALTAAAATGHDCGHGPAGHASEGALSPFVEGGYHHAVYGADVVLAPLNLCVETLDAIRNHSWNRPSPSTPEGEVVAWADRIAYVCHDFEDAVAAGVVTLADLPPEVADVVGRERRVQLGTFITAMLDTIAETGTIALRRREADALDAFRSFNYERIYLRPEAAEQARRVIALIRGLTEHLVEHPREARLAARVRRGPRRGSALRERHDRSLRPRSRRRAARLVTRLAAPGGLNRGSGVGKDVDEASALPEPELHDPIGGGEQRVVAAPAHVLAGVEAGAPLAHDDGAGRCLLPVEQLHAEALGGRVAAVAGGTPTLGLRHGATSPWRCR